MSTVYVATTGSDAYTYAQAQNPATPWLTPGKVQTSATTGDTVSVAAGTYTFAAITFTKSFTWTGAALSLGFPTTIIDAGGANVQWGLVGDNNFTNIRFSNGIPLRLWALSGGDQVFNRCEFKDIGVLVTTSFIRGGATCTFTFNGCLFNDVYNSHTSGAQLMYQSSTTFQVTMNNCTFYCLSNVASAQLCYSSTATILKNCIFYSTVANALTFANWPYTATYCDFFQCTSAPAGTGNITSDPLFLDVANRNFRLRATSPCISGGTVI